MSDIQTMGRVVAYLVALKVASMHMNLGMTPAVPLDFFIVLKLQGEKEEKEIPIRL